MAGKSKINPYTGIILVKSFFALLAVNVLVIALANKLFPESVVLGTHALNVFWVLVHVGSTLAIIDTLTIPLIHEYENMRGKMLSGWEWMMKYFAINFVAIWLITRFSEQFGMGISAWWWAAILALVIDVLQGGVMMTLYSSHEKK